MNQNSRGERLTKCLKHIKNSKIRFKVYVSDEDLTRIDKESEIDRRRSRYNERDSKVVRQGISIPIVLHLPVLVKPYCSLQKRPCDMFGGKIFHIISYKLPKHDEISGRSLLGACEWSWRLQCSEGDD
jgi:hypothetical protein